MQNAIRMATVVIAACLALVAIQGCHVNGDRLGLNTRKEWGLDLDRPPGLSEGPCVCEETIEGGRNQPIAYKMFSGRVQRPRNALTRPLGAPPLVSAGADFLGHSRFHPVPTAPVFSPRNRQPEIGVSVEPMSAAADVRVLQFTPADKDEPPKESPPLQQPESVTPSLVSRDRR